MTESKGSERHPSLTDDQTGLPNRLHFDTVFEVAFAMGPRGIPLTVVLLEMVPFFDWVSETGRAEVDRVLRHMGSAMAPAIRQSDLIARWDETRFALCLVDCNLAGAVLVADRIDALMDPIRETTDLGFNLGGAVFDLDMEQPSDLTGAALEALRIAKDKGRNQMEFHR